MRTFGIATALLLAGEGVNAFTGLRFGCSQLTIGRFDPIVFPGQSEAGHLHQFVGGNGLNYTLDGDVAAQSTCTTCQFAEDFSNYWTATLFFKARNGTYKAVKQIPNVGSEGAYGGMTVYYEPADDAVAFKPGFRMLVGYPNARTSKDAKAKGLSYICLTTISSRPTGTKTMPTAPCAAGIVSFIRFPTCWDGTNLDATDHISHTAYKTDGVCPSTHPVVIPQVTYEVIWDTAPFNDKSIWPEDGSQPFVWSVGDQTGYSNHADYVFGWEGDSLQKALDAKCQGMKCDGLTQQKITGSSCVPENVGSYQTAPDGWLTELPGGIKAARRAVTFES